MDETASISTTCARSESTLNEGLSRDAAAWAARPLSVLVLAAAVALDVQVQLRGVIAQRRAVPAERGKVCAALAIRIDIPFNPIGRPKR